MAGRTLPDTSDWGAFGTGDRDAQCEAERQAFTAFFLQRLNGSKLRGIEQPDILVGSMMGLTQMLFAMMDMQPTESDREAFHQVFDHCWVQCLTHDAVLAKLGKA